MTDQKKMPGLQMSGPHFMGVFPLFPLFPLFFDSAGLQMSRQCERRQACGNLQSIFLIENMRSPRYARDDGSKYDVRRTFWHLWGFLHNLHYLHCFLIAPDG